MRILFLCNQWHIARTPCRTVGRHPELREGRHRWIRALAAPEAPEGDILLDYRRDTLRTLVNRLPGGPPDVMVVWEPGYQALPPGIEDAPFPVVACYSDWNLVACTQAGMLDAYDHVFTDRRGVRLLDSMGYRDAEYWPMWGHDPDASRVLPGVEKSWDVGMVGNLNADVQRERAPWLARVAALADRYRVRIAGGVYGEDYTRMINATRITFNRSIRGEMNMRCYEAAACGSLLFYEEENEEIRDFFEDGVHCVLYNERNLEERLEHYLSRDDERERIVSDALARVAEFSLPRSLNRLADRLEELDLGKRTGRRRIRALPTAEVRKRQARQSAGMMSLGSNEAALSALREAHSLAPGDPDVLNDMAVVASLQVARSSDLEYRRQTTRVSLQHMRRAVSLCPQSAFFRLNLAHMEAAVEAWEAAVEQCQEAMALLDGGGQDPAHPLCLPFPFEWNEFRVQSAVLFNGTRARPESLAPLRQCLLLHRAGALLLRAAAAQQLAPLAALGGRIAAAARPDLGAVRAELARLLAEHGAADEALGHLDAALETDPFLTEAWPLYARLLLELRGEAPACDFIERALTVLSAVAPARERWAASGSVMEMDAVREALKGMVRQLALAA